MSTFTTDDRITAQAAHAKTAVNAASIAQGQLDAAKTKTIPTEDQIMGDAKSKTPHLLAMARKLASALRQDVIAPLENETEIEWRKRRAKIIEQGASVLDMLAGEFERVSALNTQLGEYFAVSKNPQSSFKTGLHSGNAPGQ
jgi:phage gpG-like protein